MSAAHRKKPSSSWIKRLFMSKRRKAAAAASADSSFGELGEERTVYVNVNPPKTTLDTHGRPPQYPPNQIRTAKYTPVSFIPKNLFEQFRRAANIYFLFLLILQFIPAVTTGMPGLSALALFTIVFLTMLKDGYEDSKRSASDKEANKARTTVLGRGWVNVNKPPAHMLRPRGPLRFLWSDSGAEGSVGGMLADARPMPRGAYSLGSGMAVDSDAWLQTEWRHLHVGDIVLLRDGDSVPADLVLLVSSEDDGTCFVETKNLDGETNLKSKTVVSATTHLATPDLLSTLPFTIDAEPPSTQLYSFKGSIQLLDSATGPEMQESLNVNNLLLRGSVIRNTSWAVGVAVFTGDDTKIMMNAGETPSKRSRIERMMNYQVLSQFCLLFVLCFLSAVLGGIFFGRKSSFQSYFIVDYETGTGKSAPLYGFLTFWTSLILYQTVVPISLYVTIEVVKSFQAYFINQDIDMYYAVTDQRCVPKAWNLSDDLGQVEYIFSDKTGTLTQNVMVFRQCTIHGKVYGELITDDDESGSKTEQIRQAMDARIDQFIANPYRQREKTTFFDTQIYDDLQTGGAQMQAIASFFSVLALCHTAIAHIPDPSRPEVIEYKAQSPDEAALVSTARDVGFTFIGRDRDQLLCSFLGRQLSFRLLATLEFTSARKRMSVIVRDENGRILLLCKGADSVILERISDNQDNLRQVTLNDLELFANHGLRTLCLGHRVLDESEYNQWKSDYDRAMASLGDRETEVEEVCDRIERDLQLIGGTAIEDKLQDGVPETIAQLALAGIKLWVLTGDKTETAINIGYSCNLLNNDMQLIVVKSDDQQGTREQLERALHEFGDAHGDLSYIGGGGGPMSGVPAKSPGSWRRLLGRKSAASANDGIAAGNASSLSKSNLKNPAFEHARQIAQNKNRRHGIKGIWDDVRTRNIPTVRDQGLRLKRDAPLALVIDGTSLKYALEPELAPLFLEIAVRCQSVLCCRVSPLQKALVVRLVKESLGTLCLSIGDGANDVSMIQEADVGIGISGEEGLQAVMASDYAIGQFRFLQKLLLVHGRWSYLRITSMVLNFFYKNIVFTVSLFWFQIYCQWSVSNVFDYALITLYNMLFTMLPPGALGVFDQDLPGFVGVVVPQLYKRGIYKLEYSMARFWMYIADGMYQSAAIIFLLVYTYYFSSAGESNGLDTSNRDDIGTVGAFCVVLITNLYMGLNNRTWTWVMPVAQLLGIALLVGVFFVYGAMFDDVFSTGAALRIFAQPNFWLMLALTAIICLMPHYIAKFIRSAWYPTDTDIVREIIHQFRHNKGSSTRPWSSYGAAGSLNYAMSNARKEVPFGAIPEHKPLPRKHRHPGAVHGNHAMDGAIPLNDIGPHLRGSNDTPNGPAGGNALNHPGILAALVVPSISAAITARHSISPLATKDYRVASKRDIATGTPRIFGGTVVAAQDFKYIAYIEAQNFVFGINICTGSLITPNVVMTAAHCTYASSFFQYSADDFQVGFTHTTPDQSVAYKGYAAKKVVVHPNFSKTNLRNDIALLILNETIPESVAVPEKLYSGDFYLDTPLRAAGFGVTDPHSKSQLAAQLMQVDLSVGHTVDCLENVSWYNRTYMLCTDSTEGGHDTCSADSGGPLATAIDNGNGTAIIGITSFGAANEENPEGLCGQKGSPGFYTRVANYIPWIASTINVDAGSISISNRTETPHELDSLTELEKESQEPHSFSLEDDGSGAFGLDSSAYPSASLRSTRTESGASTLALNNKHLPFLAALALSLVAL
ncbi:phospholipid transporting ATPase [Coemansia erecta]|nr:phospholipid transporting ATPase [Coemansia erecta]